MSNYDLNDDPNGGHLDASSLPEPLELTPPRAIREARGVALAPPDQRRRIRLPVLLFVATCLSTLFVSSWVETPFGIECDILMGLKYAIPVMTILICHEAGHFLQTRRHGVRSSLPYFLPMPFGPLGTFGAVIGMDSHIRNRRALFDIGITGPLAGLVPTIVFCVLGLYWSEYEVRRGSSGNSMLLGDPLLLQWLTHWIKDPIPSGEILVAHPTFFAGWVGLLITAVNLMPIGQLDGGHVLYALLRTRAHLVARLLLFASMAAVVLSHYYMWAIMLCLLMVMGPDHPPTANDQEPLGLGRTILGWSTLAFIPIGLTPTPIILPGS